MASRYFKSHKKPQKVAKPLEPCAICRRDAELVQDHCHTSKLCRDRICNRCNVLLGLIESRRSTDLDKLLAYIERWEWEHEHGGTPYRAGIVQQVGDQDPSNAIH